MPSNFRQPGFDVRGPALARLGEGSRFGGYRIVRKLGCGGTATVYLAHEAALDRHVALKLLHGDADLADRRARFAHEARIAARLEHPAILPVYRSGVLMGTPWMAMRYADGGDLRTRLHRGASVLPALAQVADALGHAHANGVVHRDLKPGNVLLDARGSAYLADFGIAKLLHGPCDGDDGPSGTPAYMAPEQALELAVTPRTDVYALGVVCFEWLTGDVPFHAPSPAALLLRHVESPLPEAPLAALPPRVAKVLRRALDKRPARRHATPAELVAALAEALEGRVPRRTARMRVAEAVTQRLVPRIAVAAHAAMRAALACAAGAWGAAAW